MTRNSPPKLGGGPARTESEQAGWFPCRYWQLREPPRPRLRSGTPPNLGGEWPHSNSFTAPMTADNTAICEIAGGHFLRLRAIALALRGPPLQWPFSTFSAKPPGSGNAFRGACSALIGAGRQQTDKFLRSLPHIACHSPNTS